jgi:Ca2+-binding EF-hand superfamily protein
LEIPLTQKNQRHFANFLFKAIDRNKNRKLDANELSEYFAAIGYSLSDYNQVNAWIGYLDRDRSVSILFDELCIGLRL